MCLYCVCYKDYIYPTNRDPYIYDFEEWIDSKIESLPHINNEQNVETIYRESVTSGT